MANPIPAVLSAIWKVLDGMRKVLHLLLLLALLLIALALSSRALPVVPSRAALVVAPAGDLVEQLDGDPVDRAFSKLAGDALPQVLLQDLVRAVAAAADDARIEVLVLRLDGLGAAGLSKLEALAEAVEDFRASGKPVIAGGDYYTQNQYYVAAHADEVYLHPLGLIFLDGYGRYRTFFREAIDKLAIDWNMFKVGEYKSFVEPYTRDNMSAEDKEGSLGWLNALWASYIADVSSARELEPGVIDGYVANMVDDLEALDGDFAGLALQRGLIDDVRPRDQVEARITELVGYDPAIDSFHQIDYLSYLAAVDGDATAGGDADVGVIVASGEILDGEQPPGTIGGDSLAALIRQARTDEEVSALVLRVDSPGGSTFASEIIARELVLLGEAGKPLIVSMSSAAASGGYWISAPADQIWAAPTTLTGSIGIFAMLPTFQRTLDKLGVHVDGVGTTPLSGQLRLDRELGPEARRLLELSIEAGYRRFIDLVAEARALDPAEVDRVARGRVWTGQQALDIGLVDKLGGLDEAIAAAAELAGLGEDYGVRYIEKPLTLSESMAISLASRASALLDGRASALLDGRGHRPFGAAPVAQVVNRMRSELTGLLRFNDPRATYAYCFCKVE